MSDIHTITLTRETAKIGDTERPVLDVVKAMKLVKDKGKYEVVSDDQTLREAAQKLGYKVRDIPKEKPKENVADMLITLQNGYQEKLESETQKIKEDYEKRMSDLRMSSENEMIKLREESERKKTEAVQKEQEKIREIKKAIKKEIYADT